MKSDIDLIKQNQINMKEYANFYKDFDISGIASVLRSTINNFKDVLYNQGVLENISKTVQQFAETMLTSKDIQIMMSTMSRTAINYMGTQISQTIMSTENIQNMISTLNLFASNFIQEEIKKIYKYDFSKYFSNLDISNIKLKQMIDEIYEETEKESQVKSETEQQNGERDFINEEEFKEAFQEHVENPMGFQERVGRWAQEKIIKYYIGFNIIIFLWSNFVQPYFQEYIGMPVMAYVTSNVKELPHKEGNVISKLNENDEATIIENEKYYYKVIFVDENGEQKEGYVAKRNVKLLLDEEE